MAKKVESKDAVLEKSIQKTDDTVLVFKATHPLSELEHAQLSEKIRFENEKSGVKVVLMPYSCEVI